MKMCVEDGSQTIKYVRIIEGAPPTGVYQRPDGTQFCVRMVMGPNGWAPFTRDWLDVMVKEGINE